MHTRCSAVVAVLLALFLLLTQSAGAEDLRRDGNWWLELNEVMEVLYLLGLSDGLELGNQAVSRMYTDLEAAEADSGISPEELAEALGVYGRHRNYLARHFAQPLVGQLADGLDEFYADYRNRSILVVDGLWYVAKATAGTTQTELDELAERYRRAAAGD